MNIKRKWEEDMKRGERKMGIVREEKEHNKGELSGIKIRMNNYE